MAQDVQSLIAAANALFRTVSGINRVFDNPPDVAPSSSGDLPCVIPIVQTVEALYQAQSYLRKNYTVKFLLLVNPYSKSLTSIDTQAQVFPDRIIDIFMPHVRLNDAANITHIGTGSISEPVISLTYGQIEYAGVLYVGWQIQMSATIKKPLVAGD